MTSSNNLRDKVYFEQVFKFSVKWLHWLTKTVGLRRHQTGMWHLTTDRRTDTEEKFTWIMVILKYLDFRCTCICRCPRLCFNCLPPTLPTDRQTISDLGSQDEASLASVSFTVVRLYNCCTLCKRSNSYDNITKFTTSYNYVIVLNDVLFPSVSSYVI